MRSMAGCASCGAVVDTADQNHKLLSKALGNRDEKFLPRLPLGSKGTLEGKPWTLAMPGGAQALQVKQYTRVEGRVDHPPQAVVKTVQVRLTDNNGAVRTTQSARM